MKKTFIIPTLLVSLLFSACTTAVPENTDIADSPIKEVDTIESLNEGILYENNTYGFALILPETWSSYKIMNRELEWSDFGNTDSLDFGFMTSEDSYPTFEEPGFASLMNISIHSHEQWEALTAAGSLMPNYLGENDEFVFAGTGSQDAPSDLM